MVVNKGKNISMTLQLVKSDGISVEEEATVSYSIIKSDFSTIEVSSQTTVYNSDTQSYVDTLVPSASWTTQDIGSYVIVWSVSDTTDDFNSVYSEPLEININNDSIVGIISNTESISGAIADMQLDVDRILGLVHQNMVIDETRFDKEGNLFSARVRIFRDNLKTDLITTYRITAVTTGPGKFSSWEQVEE